MITIIIVNHNHGKMLRDLIFSFESHTNYKKYRFIIIDNKPVDEILTSLEKKYSWLEIYSNFKPRGFSSNINQAIKRARDTKYLILINPDVVIKEDIIDNLKSYMDSNGQVGIVAPKLLNMNGTSQYSARKFSDPLTTVIRGLRLENLALFRKYNDAYLMKNKTDDGCLVDVDWVTGAFMFIRYDALVDVGLFDDKNFFLYSEDQDMCIRMWKNNWKVQVLDSFRAYHHYQREGVQNIFSKHFLYQLVSTYNLFKKYNWKLTR